MTDPLTPQDPKPNSDQVLCENCEFIIDKFNIIKNDEGDQGCTECISNCAWCGKAHFNQDMYHCPYYGLTCNECLNTDDYKKAVRNSVLKEALRFYFDDTECKRTENKIIEVTQKMGYFDLANEMCGDINK